MITDKENNLVLNLQVTVNVRGGVLEDVLGLEDTFWCPCPRRSSPRPWSLKFSIIALSSARTAIFFELLKFCRSPEKNFWRPFFGDRLKKIFKDLFIFWKTPQNLFEDLFFWRALALAFLILGLGVEHSYPSLERVCPWKGCLWPWPRTFFVFLALAWSLVSSTPRLVNVISVLSLC